MRLKRIPPASMAIISERPAIFEVKNMTAMNTINGKIMDIIKGAIIISGSTQIHLPDCVIMILQQKPLMVVSFWND